MAVVESNGVAHESGTMAQHGPRADPADFAYALTACAHEPRWVESERCDGASTTLRSYRGAVMSN
ncbi:MAG: hypothetical protein J2P41_06720 [Blastocatellia bacterium]|nr:hypothetical protein [Blastocatellia bacterium]